MAEERRTLTAIFAPRTEKCSGCRELLRTGQSRKLVNMDGSTHNCSPPVKVYTREEIDEFYKTSYTQGNTVAKEGEGE